jgi:DNA-directed RNA polymerase sigma subunit (sigma70/sigma32)
MTRTDWAGYELSENEARIVDAIAALEAAGRPTYLDDIAEEAGLPRETVRWLLRRLLRETNLVHEVVPETGPDLGPYYEIAPKD